MNHQLLLPRDGDVLEHAKLLSGLREQIRPTLVGILLLTLLTGIAFPLVLGILALPLFSHQAEGSLVTSDGVVVGSEVIGQSFSGPKYFHSRPSAAGDGYDATVSGGTNLGPVNPKLRDGAKGDPADPAKSKPFAGVRQLAEAYRPSNGLRPDAAIPIDAVTRSGSGLDPHISPANAAMQVPRVARERKLNEEGMRRLVAEHTKGRQLGFLGAPRVSVLSLNLALDRLAPRSSSIPNN
ncbi:MAG: potassium-transporting ATPase subunit KdpC [Deltaproteobacteria bacterium]|nr:potassium-transporting ATPase subunit KdpC [Deltaproteobacteria bacterium]